MITPNIKILSILILMLTIFAVSFRLKAQLPQSYDLRPCMLVSPVKDQGTCGACWAFATIAAIESNWMKLGHGLQILSEDNLIDCHGFDEAPCAGGSFYMSHALLSRHGGPLTSANDPYTPNVSNCPINLPIPPLPPAYVEEFRFLPPDIQIVKQAVWDHGAVATAMFFNIANYNAATYKYYDNVLDATDSLYPHCVAIAGWDDNMTFPGAPSNGGWIIKDSYGTSWADNGYFYVSYYDAGILSETAYFPGRQELSSPAANHVYYYDKYGWVDNFGFNSNTAYGVVHYTLSPAWGAYIGQQIKRVGTYAVEDNTTITMEIFKSYSMGTLSNLVASGSIQCPVKGFYTIPFHLNTDTLGTDFFIKVTYQAPAGTTKPVPVEIYEPFHTSGIQLSSNSCFVSSDGSNWQPTGLNTSLPFDLCIKMYTVDAPKAQIHSVSNTACAGDMLMFTDVTPMPKDSVQWFINDVYQHSAPMLSEIFPVVGMNNVSLVAFYAGITDTMTIQIQVNPLPGVPVITQSGDTLFSSPAVSYQWHDINGPVPGENGQFFLPPAAGTYSVKVYNQYMCSALSAPFSFTPASIEKQTVKQPFVSPNPFNGKLTVSMSDMSNIDKLFIYDINGSEVFSMQNAGQTVIDISLPDIPSGSYFLKVFQGKEVFNYQLIAE
jgi:C1A family cysteine protease